MKLSRVIKRLSFHVVEYTERRFLAYRKNLTLTCYPSGDMDTVDYEGRTEYYMAVWEQEFGIYDVHTCQFHHNIHETIASMLMGAGNQCTISKEPLPQYYGSEDDFLKLYDCRKTSKMQSVWEAVVRFIQWYNQNKSNETGA